MSLRCSAIPRTPEPDAQRVDRKPAAVRTPYGAAITINPMTDPETLADEDLAMSGYPADDLVDAGYAWDDYIDGSYLDDDWAAIPAQPAPAPSPPWFRNPRLLFGLITVAAAALVVASVLLITGSQSGEIPTTPQLSTRATPSSAAEPSPRPSSQQTATATSPTAESSSSDAVETAEPPAPQQQVVPSAAPPHPPAAEQPRTPAGPNLNVTRTPMSFTPGKH